jgi:hypothetical protein
MINLSAPEYVRSILDLLVCRYERGIVRGIRF